MVRNGQKAGRTEDLHYGAVEAMTKRRVRCSVEGTDVVLRGYARVFFASLLSFFNRAELEHAAWIVFGCNGPPTSTVSEEPFEV